MSFLSPLYLVMGAVVAASVIALHFLARQRPRAAPLPTARFVPEGTARAPSRSPRPRDLALLLLRVVAVLLVGAAFAGPALDRIRAPVVRVVLLDVSSSVRSAAATRERAASLLRDGDILVVFDSSARMVGGAALDSIRTIAQSRAVGSLSAGLVASLRAAADLTLRADSIELVIVSPFLAEEWDSATADIRALWQGRAALVMTEGVVTSELRMPVEIRGPAEDPLRSAASLMGTKAALASVRLLREPATAADSDWVRDSTRVLIQWTAGTAHSETMTLERTDTVGAVLAVNNAHAAVVVAPFERRRSLSRGRVVARWVDGFPAALERPLGAGCVREVDIPVPARGDLVLRESVRRLLQSLMEPCGGLRETDPLDASLMAIIRGQGALVATRGFPSGEQLRPLTTTWLLMGATFLLLLEHLVRRRRATA